MSHSRRLLLLVLFGLWQVQTSASGAEPSPVHKLLKHCEGLDNSFECARTIERAQSQRKDRAYFQRNGNRLTLRLATKNIILRDRDLDDDRTYHYSYFMFLPEAKLHVVHVQFYEGQGFAVVHHLTGELARIDGVPHPSPDFRRFVSISHGGEAQYDPTSVEIWRVRNGRMWPEYRYESDPWDWGPARATWLDRRTIHIDGLCLEEKRTCRPARVSMKAGRWRLTR